MKGEPPSWDLQTGLGSLRSQSSWWQVGRQPSLCYVTAACDLAGRSLEPMLRLPMPPEVHLPLEALSTQVAAEGLEACVLAAVGDEVGALAERLAAHLALVGLLTSVDKGVFLHV